MRKLRRAAEAAVTAVETARQHGFGGSQGRWHRRRWPLPRVAERCRPVPRAVPGLGGDVLAAIAVGFGHALAKIGKAGQAVARFFGEIGAAEKGRAVGREEHGQRPAAAAPRQHLVRGLVDLVEVGALLAIDLDVDEQAVHHRRHALVLEGFVGHDVAPVAGRIAYRKQDRPVLRRARVSVCSSQGCQCTGLSACCSR
jgi:hypothetical protein